MRSLALLVALLAMPLEQARAAGNAHVVDDSEVETPGTCHLELWTTVFLQGDGYGNFAPACTALKIPWLEMGAAYAHDWDASGAPLLGPQIKVNFRSADRTNLGLAVGLNAAMNLKTGDFALGQMLALVTVPVTDKAHFNFNAGWRLRPQPPCRFR